MFEHIDGGAGTYAHYLLERLSVNKEFDFYVITPDLKKTRENVIKIRKLETFYKTTINYRLAVDKFSKNYTDIIVHASSCNELIAFKDSGYKLIANVNDYEVCNVYKLLPLYLKILVMRQFLEHVNLYLEKNIPIIHFLFLNQLIEIS